MLNTIRESTTVGDATTDMADTTAASDDDDDSSHEESDEEEAKNEPKTPVKKVEEVKANGDVKSPKEKKKEAGKSIETPKTKAHLQHLPDPLVYDNRLSHITTTPLPNTMSSSC